MSATVEGMGGEGRLINHRIEFVSGPFDMVSGQMVCVKHSKYMTVELCFTANMNVPFAKIVLHDRDRYVDAKAVFADAGRLGDEIVRRWNAARPEQPEVEVCDNCGTAMPEGCQGRFNNDGAACRLNTSELGEE